MKTNNRSISALLAALSCGVAFGCGATDETRVSPELAEGQSDVPLIDRVNWNGEEISFFDASTAEDPVPGILVTVLGSEGTADLERLFVQQTRYLPTPAELWRAATGDDQVPDELMRQHEYQVAEDGRDAGLRDFDASLVEVSKAFVLGPSHYTQLFLSTPPDPGTPAGTGVCWANAVINVAGVGSGAPSSVMSVCTNQAGAPIRRFGADVACSTSFNVNATVRSGFYNGTAEAGVPKTSTSKHCFATGSASWQCGQPTFVSPNFFFGSTFTKNGSAHRLATDASYPTTGLTHNGIALGTAKLTTGIPTFEYPTLCAVPPAPRRF